VAGTTYAWTLPFAKGSTATVEVRATDSTAISGAWSAPVSFGYSVWTPDTAPPATAWSSTY
jgi:hypothetical protein